MHNKNNKIYKLTKQKKLLKRILAFLSAGIIVLLLLLSSKPFLFNTEEFIKITLLVTSFFFLYIVFKGLNEVNKDLKN